MLLYRKSYDIIIHFKNDSRRPAYYTENAAMPMFYDDLPFNAGDTIEAWATYTANGQFGSLNWFRISTAEATAFHIAYPTDYTKLNRA